MLLALIPFPASPETSSSALATNTLATSTPDSAKLGWILIRNRWISAAQLQAVLAQQPPTQQPRRKLGELLLSAALITEGQLKQALREQYWRRNGYWII
ncbi:MAG: hypothetical protein KME07_19160 [Pegethrix bostrychoides GSE-TBD4-15B]|jgi:hypothetical protein|uniref:Uncharacterized protein n=1 Tax=Pegethrix bostrychoides GSE-TBD4-15B TaxID=2839662 RepID=A0A951U6I6_9CYAN|nr:hypothetical protein [Pegethrix bostrychoides GSE-TBD4-15B]